MWKLIRRILFALLLIAIVLNWTWAKLPGEPPLPAGSKFVEVDGRNIHYVEKPGKDPAVLMIHGLPGTWGDWDDVTAELKGRHTIAIDRPGFAFSSEGYVPYSEQLTLLHNLADKLKLDDPVIAGHSYGGSFALGYAQRYPKDVSGIVAVDPAVSPDDITHMRLAQARFIKLTQVPVVNQVLNLTVSQLVRTTSANQGGTEAFDPDPRSQAWLDRTLSLNMRERDTATFADEMLNAQTALTEVQGMLPKIDIPVRIIQGQDDLLVPTESVQAASKQIKNVSLTILPGGHMQTYTHPDIVARAINRAAR